ncbi:MAG: DciA family protein [Desertifilum sp.]|nr:DciA family protein [Desertifilum sp.]MDI9640612.1 DciA family protein [Geitlerinema splendidum]
MSFDSIDRVLHQLQARNTWQAYQQFRYLCHLWEKVVEPAIAAQTRPVAVTREVLQVATSSSVWVQELKFKRYRILEQLNPHLSIPLKDIRFSTAYWRSPRLGLEGLEANDPQSLWQNHPSRLPETNLQPPLALPSPPQTPQQAFQQWRDRAQWRSRHLPLCPQCQAPTPPGELERWAMCALCAAHQWQQ